MALFQTSVLKQHISLQDKDLVNKAYKKYAKYFLNPTIQDNIRSSKEEEYQGIFLTELFANILGYTLKPNANFNLVAEYKNQNNARKADGAILNNDVAIGVIELKGTNTKDLESIRKQAFDYKANQKGCIYVITSNFEKLRFYINDATEFEEFNLFELSQERFELLYLCLQKDNILNNVPLNIKEASVVEEEQITKQFYKDYSLFKRELYRDLVKRNAKPLKAKASNVTSSAVERSQEEQLELQRLEKNVKLTLFKKSQKLIDRYLFIFFAEDRGLLPANSTQQILDKWKDDVDFGDDRPLYTLFKQYFNFLDQGRAVTTKRAEIYAYNGGLFKEDKTLDSLEIDSELLYKHTSKLAAYDFESQVDVNILGHIFENSLNEIESVNAEIEGGDFDKQKSKRKKDGVFYTPKYITKYIVENTIGKLCDEKKTELGFKEEEYFKGRKNRQKATITKLVNILDTYRDWLLQLTICDPACGSGAFLNQALDFLIKEHTYIDELKTKVLGGGLQFPDIENTILENNIYGVDLNEESVEIAKLSLWLRTAQPRRKLNDLSSNIKCGNSLIDSKAVAGDKAFNWETQFPKVFDLSSGSGGGFDVIIGNPPYGAKLSKIELEYIVKKHVDKGVSKALSDTYIVFYIKCLEDILRKKGLLGFITPNTWRLIISGKDFRYFITDTDYIFEEIVEHQEKVFIDATVDCDTLIIRKEKKEKHLINISIQKYSNTVLSHLIEQKELAKKSFFNLYLTEKAYNLKEKIEQQSVFVKDVLIIKNGVKPYEKGKGKPAQTAFTMKEKPFTSEIQINDEFLPLIGGSSFHRYKILWDEDFWIKYGVWLAAPRDKEIFSAPEKLIFRQTGDSLIGTYVDDKFIMRDNTHIILPKNKYYNLKYVLAVLSSKLSNFIYWTNNPEKGEAMAQIKLFHLGLLCIKDIDLIKQKYFIEKAEIILRLNVENSKISKKFIKYLNSQFSLQKLSKKLQNWHELDFGEFIKELNKAIKANNKLRIKDGLAEVPTLTKKDEFEWLDLFEENKQKAQALQTQINQTDKEIDAMVYELYGLTEEEIKIVENS
ncbi:N-6 DNA methylase [Polaribacter sp. R2A056_3_33]|uniref:Eco57I restriction-modification methylase domain-containing protein n=1 Tax=Polaribacter sp. R2A056_3_33 TaxID=2745563 RepID=UPI001C4F5B4B|nr:N-6 DNA methylase [Polaribacter sp. R2A056_3_33]QXP68961.1 N-6 DNA methylase [Polaribacter sp. R2A056_3_33]